MSITGNDLIEAARKELCNRLLQFKNVRVNDESMYLVKPVIGTWQTEVMDPAIALINGLGLDVDPELLKAHLDNTKYN